MGAQACGCSPCHVAEKGLSNSEDFRPKGNGTNKPVDQDALDFLSQVPLFKRLPKTLHPALAQCAHTAQYLAGQSIIQQDEKGDEFFVIKDGEASVSVGGQRVATLKAGDYFGEQALLRDVPRTATITSVTTVHAYRITRVDFQRLGLNQQLEFPHRLAVGGGCATHGGSVVGSGDAPSVTNPKERRLIAEALKKNQNLQMICQLDDTRVGQLIDAAWSKEVPQDTVLIRQGDVRSEYFYIVKAGCFEVFVDSSLGRSAEEAIAGSVGNLGKGDCFGELALLYSAPRAATVKARTDGAVWVIGRKEFKSIITKSAADSAKAYIRYLDEVEFLKPLKVAEKEALAKALDERVFSNGEEIFHQGEKGDTFYILIEGEVAVLDGGKQVAKLATEKGKAQFFGERALLKNEPRAATVQVKSSHAKTLMLDRNSFNMLLGSLEALHKVSENRESETKAPGSSKDRFGKIKLKDLNTIGVLGFGGFGSVMLVEHKKTKETYALKSMSKGYVVKTGLQDAVVSEKTVQLMCDSPFVVKLFETYNSDQSLYLLLEPALGGELYSTYSRKSLFGKVAHAQFYSAGVVFAFDHLHSLKIIFRDLKPENLLLNDKGQIKLTDMGLAKVVIGKTHTTCGTPDYFAPEIIANKGHGVAVDWWTLGILIFELMCGHPPFESSSPLLTYKKVTKGIDSVKFPPAGKGSVEAVVKGLCCAEPSTRLPMLKGGSDRIKKHDWYKEKAFDWGAMEALTLDPPFKPVVKGKTDLENFSTAGAQKPPEVPYKSDGSGWDKDFATST